MSRAAKGEGSIFPNPAGGWRGYITVNGRRKYSSGTTKSEVAQKLRELKNQRDAGVLTLGRAPTTSAWLAHWLAAKKPSLKIKTYETYRDTITWYVPAWLGDVRLDKLTAEHLEQAYDVLRERGLAESTIGKLHGVMRGALKVARKRGHVGFNAADLVVSPPSSKAARVEPFNEADLGRIYEEISGTVHEARWTFALELGPRPGEVIALEWPDVNFDEESITIRQQLQTIDGKLRLVKYAKTDSGQRKVPLPPYLAEIFRQHRERQLAAMSKAKTWGGWHDLDEPSETIHAWVFPSQSEPGQPISPSGDNHQWGRILERAGVAHTRRYTCRHTAASRMIAAGIDLTVVAEILGHANIQMLVKVYAHALEDRKRLAGAVLDMAWRTRGAAPDAAPYRAGSERFRADQSDSTLASVPRNHGSVRATETPSVPPTPVQ